MKKSLQNLLTTVLGFIIILAAIASIFIPVAHEIMTTTYYIITFAVGFILIYVKNEKATGFIKSLFKFK